MRTLRFLIEGQKLKKDTECDFKGLIPGTRGYLEVAVSCSDEWNDCRKAVVFKSKRTECAMPLLGGKCQIPEEILKGNIFTLRVVGERKGYRITTNQVGVTQDG